MIVSTANKIAPIYASAKSTTNKTCEEALPDTFSHKLIAKASARMARAEKKARLFTHPTMKLFTQSQLQKLQSNFSKNDEIMQTSSEISDSSPETIDFKPVVKLFTPDGACNWLLTELSPDLIAFGLCDLGFGEPEMGYVSVAA